MYTVTFDRRHGGSNRCGTFVDKALQLKPHNRKWLQADSSEYGCCPSNRPDARCPRVELMGDDQQPLVMLSCELQT